MILASKERQGSKSSRLQPWKKYQNPNEGSTGEWWRKCGDFPGLLVSTVMQAAITDKPPNLRGVTQ